MKKKRKKSAVLALWGIFLFMVFGIVFLSFQNGIEAKELSNRFILQFVQSISPQSSMTNTELQELTYDVRQGGRVLAFLLLGVVGTMAVHLSFPKCSWCAKTGVTALILVAIAFLTEKLKIYIPTRHYSYEEMMVSISAVMLGFSTVSLVILAVGALKDFFRSVTAEHS